MRKSSIGSPAYLSPEQLNKSYYNHKIDMWSVGIMTYELLIGQSPFDKQIHRLLTTNKSELVFKDLYFPSEIDSITKDFINNCL